MVEKDVGRNITAGRSGVFTGEFRLQEGATVRKVRRGTQWWWGGEIETPGGCGTDMVLAGHLRRLWLMLAVLCNCHGCLRWLHVGITEQLRLELEDQQRAAKGQGSKGLTLQLRENTSAQC